MTGPIEIFIDELVLPPDADPDALRTALRTALSAALAAQVSAGEMGRLEPIVERTVERVAVDSLAALSGGTEGTP